MPIYKVTGYVMTPEVAMTALPGADDFVEITRRQGRDAPVVHFLSDTQIEAINGEYPPTPQGEDDEYESRFQLRLYGIVRFALANGFIETLSAEDRDAIRNMVVLEVE